MTQGGGEAGTVANPLAQGGGDLPQDGGVLAGLDDLKSRFELEAGFEQFGHLLGEKQEVVGGNAALETGRLGGRIGSVARVAALGFDGNGTELPGDELPP